MANTPDTFHCPYCGHSISGQEPSSRKLFSYIKQLESFARIPTIPREALREGINIMASLRLLPVLVARMDHYVNLVNQHTANLSDKEKAEMYAELLNQTLRAIIPIIDHKGGSVFEFGHESILAAWGSPMFEDGFTRAVSTALEMQEVLLKLGEEQTKSRDFTLKIGLAGGPVYAGMIGISTHQSFNVVGPVAIEAARLSDVAEPGQTLVSHFIYKWTKDEIVYKQLAPKSELAEPIQLPYYVALREKVASV